MAAFQQTAPSQAAPPPDSIIVRSPLPGGVAAVTRFLLSTVPQWVQLAGLVLAIVVAVIVVVWVVRNRARILAWLTTRSRAVAWTLGVGAVVLLIAMAGFGAATWNYTQHSNDFCTSCHVMHPAYWKFADVGNKHGDMSCHSCHTQSVFASAWQLYFWLKERPDKIGVHATVENRVCETCHVTSDTAAWQRIRSTAGHRVHLESDSSALKNVKCVTCHGAEVHRFQPARATCGQSGCHTESDTKIVMEKMKGQTIRHCTICHQFTAQVPALATTDSARGTLVPGRPQCFGCHDMKKALPDFDPAKDPHGGKCGTCHNPHTQQTAAEAAKSCTTAACHGNWRTVPFHVGAAHRKVAAKANCITCHTPHQAKVDASDCTGCHANVRSRGNLKPPMPFDTTKALRRASTSPASGTLLEAVTGLLAQPRTTAPHVDETPPPSRDGIAGMSAPSPPPATADTFPHARHAKLACLVCHSNTSTRSRLTFERPRGCQICHHQARSSARCATCHQQSGDGGTTTGFHDSDGARSSGQAAPGRLRARASYDEKVRGLSHHARHARAGTGNRAVQGLPLRSPRRGPRVLELSRAGRPEGGAHIARGGARAVRRVPHGDDRRRADAHAHVLQHLPRGKGRESLPAEGMQRLPFPD